MDGSAGHDWPGRGSRERELLPDAECVLVLAISVHPPMNYFAAPKPDGSERRGLNQLRFHPSVTAAASGERLRRLNAILKHSPHGQSPTAVTLAALAGAMV
jgi:hypothetical protein